MIRFIEPRLNESDRTVLIHWAEHLLSIRQSNATALQKARRAIAATYSRDVVVALLTTSASAIKDLAWDDRSWSARLGIGAAAVTAASFGGQGAGIAALGGAVGVPLWIVLGAGGSFAGMLIDELSKALPERRQSPSVGEDIDIIDAEWEFIDPALESDLPDELTDGSALPQLQSVDAISAEARKSLWQVFRAAYRDARQRQLQQSTGPEPLPSDRDGTESGVLSGEGACES